MFHSHGLVLDILGMHIDTVVHPLQAKRASSHDHSTTREETNPAGSTQNIKNGIRIPSIMLIAFLDPEPVGNGDTAADAQSRQYGNSVWWGEKEEVQDQCYRGCGVEGEIGSEGNPGGPVWEDEGFVDLNEVSVQAFQS